MKDDQNIDPRILDGADLLDKKKPGWWHKIDLEALDQRDESRCVLGQLYGNYHKGLRALALYQGQAVDHGFNSRIFSHAGDTDAWHALIEARRAVDDAPQTVPTDYTVQLTLKELALITGLLGHARGELSKSLFGRLRPMIPETASHAAYEAIRIEGRYLVAQDFDPDPMSVVEAREIGRRIMGWSTLNSDEKRALAVLTGDA
tara:strand:+ start:1659 stop:2267 length:609 start_codon:yes stop_codon:yes gene_type:complete